MYQLLPFDTPFGASQLVKRIADNAFIPFDEGNVDYQQYLAWLAEGNAPIGADEPLPVESSEGQ